MRKLMLIGILLSFFLGSTVYAFPPRPIPPVYRGELIVDGVNFTLVQCFYYDSIICYTIDEKTPLDKLEENIEDISKSLERVLKNIREINNE